jgi:hypothetical protein
MGWDGTKGDQSSNRHAAALAREQPPVVLGADDLAALRYVSDRHCYMYDAYTHTLTLPAHALTLAHFRTEMICNMDAHNVGAADRQRMCDGFVYPEH